MGRSEWAVLPAMPMVAMTVHAISLPKARLGKSNGGTECRRRRQTARAQRAHRQLMQEQETTKCTLIRSPTFRADEVIE
jgi:hypothetical protein